MAGFVDFSYLAATINQGQAIFSTNFGESGPRTAIEPLPPIILRYNPRVDVPALKDTLRQKFLLQCNAVTAPIDNLYQYFDHYDLHVQGAEFIYAVLVEIALENSTRGKQVLDFAGRWKTENFEEFHNLTALTSNLFTEEEKQVYDEDFLNDALAELKKLRDTFSSNHTHGTSVPAGEHNLRQPECLTDFLVSQLLRRSNPWHLTVEFNRIQPTQLLCRPSCRLPLKRTSIVHLNLKMACQIPSSIQQTMAQRSVFTCPQLLHTLYDLIYSAITQQGSSCMYVTPPFV